VEEVKRVRVEVNADFIVVLTRPYICQVQWFYVFLWLPKCLH